MDLAIYKTYDATSRQLSITVNATPLIDETGTYKISVYLTESGIVDLQENQGTIIEDYEHNHVLRDMLTSATGDDIATSLVKNKLLTRTYAYTVPATFNAAKMEIVAMVSRNTGDDKSVLQAAGVKVTE